VRLDGLSITNLNWIKIDVEGAEYETLQGLKDHLRKFAPQLIVEVYLHENKNEILRLME
jgi:FkbM family methyltransferase